MRKSILIALVALCILNVTAQVYNRAQRAVDVFATDSIFAHASLSVAIKDIATDSIIAHHNANLACITASTMKTITASSGLLLLGADFTFKTPVYIHGEIKGNKLKGDLVIVGCGDPTLGSQYFPHNPNMMTEIVEALKKTGINKIEGRIMVDESCRPFPPYNAWWGTDDLAWSYGAGLHAFNFCDNTTLLKFKAENGQIHDCRLIPPNPGVSIINRLDTHAQDDDIQVFLEYANPAYVLTGHVENKEYELSLANPLPACTFADSLMRTLKVAGIKVKGNVNAIKKAKQCHKILLTEHHSVPLKDIITSLLDRSDNMFSDGLLLAIARNSGRKMLFIEGCAVIDSLWNANGIDTSPLMQYDGSGLARANKNSALFFVQMLDYMTNRPINGTYLHELMSKAEQRVGQQLATSSLAQNIVLKSGSMTAVQCYVGYYPAQNPQYAFAVLVNSWTGTRKSMKDKIDAMLINIFTPQS